MIITTSESHKSKQKLPGCFLYTYLGLIETDPSSHLTEGAYKNAGKNKNRNIAPEKSTHIGKGEKEARVGDPAAGRREFVGVSITLPAAGPILFS